MDQGVVQNSSFPHVAPLPPVWGTQSLRFSNLCNNGSFGVYPSTSQIFSPLIDPAAGENEANKVFTFEFSFIPTTGDYEPGLYVSVSPDNGTGHRMFRVDLTSTGLGVLLDVADAPLLDKNIVAHPVALLDPSVPHTIMVSMLFKPGENNDIVRVSVDGTDAGQCFTSWENYYQSAQPENVGQNTSDLEFRAALGGFDTPNAGYLFDNVSYSSSNGPGPQGCDVPIEKQADSPTVAAGGLAGFRITAHNRGRLSERNLLLCDRIPRETTFVTANRKLRRIGSKRCLFIPRLGPGQRTSFHLTLRVKANAKPGTLDNTADETPVQPPSVPTAPPAVAEDLPPQAAEVPVTPIEKATAPVKVVAKRAAPPSPPPPAVTG